MVPRFSYTFPTKYYFKALIKTILLRNRGSSNYNNYYFYNYARTALRILLSSVSYSSLRVGVQAYTCHTVFEAIKRAGHEIVFIDINSRFQMSLEDLRAKIENIDILIITHTFGFPEDLDQIKSIANDKIIIEDCSHSYMSKYKGLLTGTLGDAAVFSTGLGKVPPVGSGGFAFINNYSAFPLLKEQDHLLVSKSFLSEVNSILKLLIYSIVTSKYIYGITYTFGKKIDSKYDLIRKMDFSESKGFKFSRYILFENNEDIKKLVSHNTSNFKYLNDQLNNYYTFSIDSDPNFNMFPLLLLNRDDIYSLLLKENIESGKHFSNSIKWAKQYGYIRNDCPYTEKVVERILTVPVHKGVTRHELDIIANLIQERSCSDLFQKKYT